MLKEAIEDAIRRGEQFRRDLVADILNSSAFQDLINNQHFINTVAKVLQTKEELNRGVRQTIQEVLQRMKVPCKGEIQQYERRVVQLEKKLDSIGRKIFSSRMKKATAKKTVRKVAKVKAGRKTRRK